MARLTTLLIAKRDAGDRRPEITRGLVNEAENASDLPAHVRADRLLQCIECWTDTLGEEVDAYQDPDIYGELLAWSESLDEAELRFLEHYLRSKGWLQSSSKLPVVSVEGYARIAELTVGSESKRVFVAMSFDDEMNRTYHNAIRPAIRRTGFDPHIVGEGRSTERIEDEAEASIRESRFVVADFTHGNRDPRGSVYYEAGFARGLGKPVVFMAKEGTLPHFNTSHFPHIFWKNDDDLEEQLTQRMRNMPQLNAGGQTG